MSIGFFSKRPDRDESKVNEAWRDEHPIDTAKEQQQNRRQFIKTVAAGSALLACGQVALVAASARRAGVKQLSNKQLVLDVNINSIVDGESILFNYPDEHSPCLLVRMSRDKVVAYSQKCTHLACPVIPKPEEGMLFCPCHKGAFNIEDGRPLYGPPKRALPRLHLDIVADGTIVINGMEQLS